MLNKRIDKIAEKFSLGYPIIIESNNSYTRVTYEEKFDDELIKALRKYKSVEYVGNCYYRYAPEIQHGYVIWRCK